jgi:cystathionine beta-lyase
MEFDYTTLPERAGYDAIAVDALGKPGAPGAPKGGFDAIPMWVADMNFLAPSCVTDAMAERLKHPTFGYFEPRDEYFDAIIRWQKDRNGVQGLTKEYIGYENGVLGGRGLCARSLQLARRRHPRPQSDLYRLHGLDRACRQEDCPFCA